MVTHVVTSRPIPPENDTSPTELNQVSADQSTADAPHTVNPSLLEKNADGHVISLKGDARREQSNMDVLHRSRKMGMKIWALEKLQRMISTINDGDLAGHGHSARGTHAGGHTRRGENDLSQVLRNELVNGPSDRDSVSSVKEMIMFKGPFIYIHDMDEKTKPVMVREYPRVSRRQDGAWPQFRSAPLGKCPFIEEPPTRKTAKHRSRPQEKERRATCKPAAQYGTRKQEAEHHPAVEKQGLHPAGTETKKERGFEDPGATSGQDTTQKVPIKEEESPKKSSESFVPAQMPRTGPFYLGREPAASGVQPSNVTSAIRSQMISSTANAPGAKAGLSKEVQELKRKVLEKSGGNVPMAAPSHRPTNLSGPKIMNEPGRSSKPHAKSKYGTANEEDTTQSEGNGGSKRSFGSRKNSAPREERRRDPKPGYCENCREKFDDFDEVSWLIGGIWSHSDSNWNQPAHANKKTPQVRPVGKQLG